MAHHKHRALKPKSVPEREVLNAHLNRRLQRALFAHYTRLVEDPEHPGDWMTYGDLEQRLRARCYQRSFPPRAPVARAAGLPQDH